MSHTPRDGSTVDAGSQALLLFSRYMNARMHKFAVAMTFALLLIAGAVDAKSHSRSHWSPFSHSASSDTTHTRPRATVTTRDSNGQIKRSPKVTESFRRVHACPSTEKKGGACPAKAKD
jgi:hypothetical protein